MTAAWVPRFLFASSFDDDQDRAMAGPNGNGVRHTASHESDQELLTQLRGDEEAVAQTAFSTLFLRHTPVVFAAVLHHPCGDDMACAEDAVQSVMIRLWQRRISLPAIEDFSGYLIRAVSRECLATRRAVGRATTRETEASGTAPAEVAPADAHVIDEELHAALQQAIQALPGRMGTIFRAWYASGLTYEAVAAQFGISPKAVDQARLRAIAQLRANPMLAPFCGD